MPTNKRSVERVLINGLYYNKEDYKNGKRIVLAAAPYGILNKSQKENIEAVEPIKVKGL